MWCRAVCVVAACSLTCVVVCVRTASDGPQHGPTYEDDEFTTCEEFSRYARFNPYSVMDDLWVVFYFFDSTIEQQTYYFYAPSSRRKKLIQSLLNDSVTSLPVNWTKPVFVMKDVTNNASALIVQLNDRGKFLKYLLVKKLKPGQKIQPYFIYFKQSVGGKYLTFMLCKDSSAYVMARPNDIPRKTKIQDEIAKIGFISRGGKSYLYRGHAWMPVPEADEQDFPTERFYWV